MPRRNPERHAFTLIELLVVIAIIEHEHEQELLSAPNTEFTACLRTFSPPIADTPLPSPLDRIVFIASHGDDV
jgi:hypothetical protein